MRHTTCPLRRHCTLRAFGPVALFLSLRAVALEPALDLSSRATLILSPRALDAFTGTLQLDVRLPFLLPTMRIVVAFRCARAVQINQNNSATSHFGQSPTIFPSPLQLNRECCNSSVLHVRTRAGKWSVWWRSHSCGGHHCVKCQLLHSSMRSRSHLNLRVQHADSTGGWQLPVQWPRASVVFQRKRHGATIFGVR